MLKPPGMRAEQPGQISGAAAQQEQRRRQQPARGSKQRATSAAAAAAAAAAGAGTPAQAAAPAPKDDADALIAAQLTRKVQAAAHTRQPEGQMVRPRAACLLALYGHAGAGVCRMGLLLAGGVLSGADGPASALPNSHALRLERNTGMQ